MRKLFILILLVTSYQLLITGATAQTPAQVLLTWQANNFYPANYAGKALATKNTPLAVAAEVLRNGKLVDLSRAELTWFVDEKLQARAEGLKEIIFTVSKSAGDSHFVRVNIRSGEEVFESSTRIPVSSPVVTLEAPYPNRLVKGGERIKLEATPYFFNVTAFEDFVFSWVINSGAARESGSDNQLVLNVGEPSPDDNSIQVINTVRNRNNLLDFATTRIRLTIY